MYKVCDVCTVQFMYVVSLELSFELPGMGMGIATLEWNGMGIQNLLLHISTSGPLFRPTSKSSLMPTMWKYKMLLFANVYC